MNATMAVATYFVTWWIVLFAVLPFRLRQGKKPKSQDAFAHASGAPSNPQLPLKFLITTVVAGIVFAVIYVVVAFRLIGISEIPFVKSST